MTYAAFLPFLLLILPLISLISTVNCGPALPQSKWSPTQVRYPSARRASTIVHYASAKHPQGVNVAEPYKWMETKSPELQTFLNQESQLTSSYLSKCSDKKIISDTIKTAYDFLSFASLQQFGPPNDPIFLYSFNDKNNLNVKWFLVTEAELEQSKRQGFPSPPGRLIFDEGSLSNDYSRTIQGWDFLQDKSLAAYSVLSNSSSQIQFLDLSPNKRHANVQRTVLQNSGYVSFTFTPDQKGIVFDIQDANFGGNSRIGYHVLGTDPSKNITLIQPNNNIQGNQWFVQISTDQKWLIVTGYTSTSAGVLFMSPINGPLTTPDKMKWISILPTYDGYMQYLQNLGNQFFFLSTRENAVNYKIVKVNVDPSKARTVKSLFDLKDLPAEQTIIPEKKGSPLQLWIPIQSKLVLNYLENAKNTFYVYDLYTGKQTQQILQDFNGNVHVISYTNGGNQGFVDTESFTSGCSIYRLRLSNTDQVVPDVILEGKPKGIDTNAFKVEQMFARSQDGTQVPFTVMYAKDYKFDGSGSAWLYFYGAFGSNTLPRYDPFLLAWIHNFGGVFAYAQIRGGAELGEQWHQQGANQFRHHTFEDLRAVSEELVRGKICANGKVILQGEGPGSEAAMVVANQGPEGLIGAIYSTNGIFDLFNLVDCPECTAEWGNLTNPQDFDNIFSYSPLQNVDPKKQYPAILLDAEPNNDIAYASQSYKMIAELQYRHPQNRQPMLLYLNPISSDPGSQEVHDNQIETNAIEQCFVSQSLGLKRIR